MKLEERLCAYGDVFAQEPLKKHTTFKIGGNCRLFVYPKNELCLTQMLVIIKEENIPFKIFGKGSNILCSDDDFEGVILCLDRYFTDFYFEDDGTCVVQSGTSIILLAHEAMKRSFSGLEFASGIPGTVGGAVFMNAGAYKSDMSKILKEVFVYHDGVCEWMPASALDFAYRHSIFQSHPDWIVLGAKCKLETADQKEIRDLMDSRRQRRLASQPLDRPCAGSMFRNPQNAQAWELIEKIGFRGKSIGGAKVSEKHANFIINDNNASANDIMELVTTIQNKVKQQFDIDLHMEVERFNWKKVKDYDLDDDIQELLQDEVETKLKELSQKKINRKRRFQKVKKTGFLLVIVILTIYFLSDASKVKSLSAKGNIFYSDEEIFQKAGLSYETRYILIPSFYMEWKLQKDPFIANAEVSKQMDGVISITVTDEEILGYIVKEEKTFAVLKDGTQQEIPSESLMSIANYALIGNFTDEQLAKILAVFYQEENPVKSDIISMISEIQPYVTSYDENMVRIVMRDGNVLYGSYNSIRLLNYYKQALASLKTHPACLSLDEPTSSIVSLSECPAN